MITQARIILLAFVVGAVALFGVWVWSLKTERDELRTQLGAERVKLELAQKEARVYKDAIVAFGKKIRAVDKEYMEARNEAAAAKRILQKHNLEKLAKAKPGLVGRRLNAGTERVFLDIEELTRSFSERRNPAPGAASPGTGGAAAGEVGGP